MLRLTCALVCGALALLAPTGAYAQIPTAFPAPAPAGAAGTTECTARAEVQVCRTYAGDDTGGFTYAVRGGGRGATWAAAGSPLDGFAAFALSDGTLLVANLDAVSNGMAVETWTVYVLPAGASAPAYQFTSKEFGRGGESFGAWNGRPVVWAGDWVWGPDPTGRRGRGLYFVGRPFVIGREGLAPATGVPVRARRFLHSFTRGSEGPVGWLRDRRAETRRVDPALYGCGSRTETERVTIRSAEWVTSQYRQPYLRLTLADGRRVGYGYAARHDSLAALVYLGTGRRLLPEDYRTPDLERRLQGRRVHLETCPEPTGFGTGVLWLD